MTQLLCVSECWINGRGYFGLRNEFPTAAPVQDDWRGSHPQGERQQRGCGDSEHVPAAGQRPGGEPTVSVCSGDRLPNG